MLQGMQDVAAFKDWFRLCLNTAGPNKTNRKDGLKSARYEGDKKTMRTIAESTPLKLRRPR
jgi:hypothetical protein